MNYFKVKNKLLYYNTDIWRRVFLCHQSIVFKHQKKLIYNRSSIIPQTFLNTEVFIYSGKKWIRRYVNRWSIGFKFGEFTWNKKIAIYKAKQIKKKKKIK